MPEQSKYPHPNALPNYEKAVILREKLEKYALDTTHVSDAYGKSSGKDKARVFNSVLGFNQSNWELLKDKILEELPYHGAMIGKEDDYGKRYTVVLPIIGPNGNTADVLTAWIILHDRDYPSLASVRVII